MKGVVPWFEPGGYPPSPQPFENDFPYPTFLNEAAGLPPAILRNVADQVFGPAYTRSGFHKSAENIFENARLDQVYFPF
jgi:hypothetical protein